MPVPCLAAQHAVPAPLLWFRLVLCSPKRVAPVQRVARVAALATNRFRERTGGRVFAVVKLQASLADAQRRVPVGQGRHVKADLLLGYFSCEL